MSKKHRQIYRKLIAILLLVVITLPVILQPGHYLLIEHHHHQSEQNSVSEEGDHLNCSIDDFQLSNVTLHSFLTVSQVICIDIALKFPLRQIYTKHELNIPFSLRAPPIS